MMLRRLLWASILLVFLFAQCGCTQDDGSRACGHESALVSGNAVCLSLEHTGLSEAQKGKIREMVVTALGEINKVLPIDNLQIRILDNSNLVIPEIGMGGFNPNPNEVIIAIDAAYESIDSSLEVNLIPQLAHEIHHAKRRRSVGYGNTLLEAMVSEGLADHFSIELVGIDPPPWSVALQNQALQEWTQKASISWNEPSYDHDSWFYGTGTNIPRWAGYAIGFELVRIYLSEHPGIHPSALWDAPATAFQP